MIRVVVELPPHCDWEPTVETHPLIESGLVEDKKIIYNVHVDRVDKTNHIGCR